MKKMFAAMVAALLLVSLASSTTFASTSVNPQWKVWQYSPKTGNGPYHSQAAGPRNDVATFAFDSLNDQALLTSNGTAYAPLGNLSGKTVTATISITPSTAGYTFTGYDTGCGYPTTNPPTVRFYFSTKLVLGAQTTFQAGLYEDQMWWSNPVSISLAALYALGTTGSPLSVQFTPALWSNLVGAYGNSLVTPYTNDFTTAASNIDQVGFSFGSGCSFAFGDGSNPAGALFNLSSFAIAP